MVAAFGQTADTFRNQKCWYSQQAPSIAYLLGISVFQEGIQNIHLFQLSLFIEGFRCWHGGLRLICDNVV